MNEVIVFIITLVVPVPVLVVSILLGSSEPEQEYDPYNDEQITVVSPDTEND